MGKSLEAVEALEAVPRNLGVEVQTFFAQPMTYEPVTNTERDSGKP